MSGVVLSWSGGKDSALALWAPLLIGLFGIGMGLALPYATAPRLALSALPPSAGLGN